MGGPTELCRYTVGAELAGERLDKAVAVLAGLSRTQARRLVEDHAALVDGSPARPTDRVTPGAVIEVGLPPAPGRLLPEPVPFDVIWEDEYLAIVAKPSGVVVHPGSGARRGTLAAGLLHRWPQLEGVGEPDRWGIVHRLDRETSGCLLVAKTSETLGALRAALARREIERSYWVLVRGGFDVPAGTVDAPIGRDRRHPTRFAVDPAGRPARTHYRVAAQWDEPAVSLLEVHPETGRTHQIRVHLLSIGHPVVGDRTYGRVPGLGSKRVWLHAFRLELRHPISGQPIDAGAPLPDELRDDLRNLGPPDRGELPD